MLRNLWGVFCIVLLVSDAAAAAIFEPGQNKNTNPYNGVDWLNQWLSGPLPGTPQGMRIKRVPNSDPIPRAPSSRPAMRQYNIAPAQPTNTRPSLAAEPGPSINGIPGMYLGVGVVVSTGKTDWNHDASSSSPTLGNPSSELIYEDVSTMALEFTGYVPVMDNYFVRGNFGVGVSFGGDGNLRDDDFFAGQVLFSSTDSAIPDTDLLYLTLDAGKKIIQAPDGSMSVSVFAGYQYWRETYEAFGLFNRLTNQTTQPDTLAVITNVVEWNSFRLGAFANYRPNERSDLSIDFAYVPYTSMHNEDSHLLRTSDASLGPAPNVIMDGTGYGFEGSIGYKYLLTVNLAAVVDLRYWLLMSDGDITTRANTSTPSTFTLNDLDTVRYGANVGLRYMF